MTEECVPFGLNIYSFHRVLRGGNKSSPHKAEQDHTMMILL